MKEGSLVKILDENEYCGLYGIVKYLIDDVAYIFCVDYPNDLYVATENNNICIIEERDRCMRDLKQSVIHHVEIVIINVKIT